MPLKKDGKTARRQIQRGDTSNVSSVAAPPTSSVPSSLVGKRSFGPYGVVKTTVRLSVGIVRALENVAAKVDVGKSVLVELALREYLRRCGEKI